jgi:DNA-binding transcriptional regulator YdaS (Cro superfamily)
MELKTYFLGLRVDERADFARRCGVALGHLRNIAYGSRSCTEGLAIAIERETDGQLTCESLCPGADWAFIRGTSARAIPEGRKTA